MGNTLIYFFYFQLLFHDLPIESTNPIKVVFEGQGFFMTNRSLSLFNFDLNKNVRVRLVVAVDPSLLRLLVVEMPCAVIM